MQIHRFPSMLAALLLVATQVSCAAPPGPQPTATPIAPGPTAGVVLPTSSLPAQPPSASPSTPTVVVPAPAPPRFGSPQLLLELPPSVGPDYRISPDGRWVAYVRLSGRTPDGGAEQRELVAHSLETGQVVPLIAGSRIGQVAWLPDGRALLVLVEPGDGHEGEILVKTLGPEPAASLLKAPAGSFGFEEPAVSPDGKCVAFTVLHDASPAPVPKIGIEVMALDGSGRRQIIEPDYFIGHLAWSPDSRRVVYFKGKGGTPPDDGEAYVAGAEEPSGPSQLLLPRARPAAWSPDGQRVLWLSEPASPTGTADLLLSGWPGLGSVRTVAKDVSASGATWVGDGRISYAENGTIYLASADGGDKPHRVNPEGEQADAPVWLPGRGLDYRSGDGAGGAIRLLPAAPTSTTGPGVTPTPTATAETDAERMEITRRLFAQYLESYKSAGDPRSRLLDYRIDETRFYQMPGEQRPRIIVIYSVLPLIPTGSNWIAGNGVRDGLWIVRKLSFVKIVRDGDAYRIESMGTGP